MDEWLTLNKMVLTLRLLWNLEPVGSKKFSDSFVCLMFFMIGYYAMVIEMPHVPTVQLDESQLHKSAWTKP